MSVRTRKKLIEVALPLDAINKESAREKSIRHGHPSTLHLWWARRPLAAARAVIFAQMVDDPSEHPDLFPTEEAQQAERERLFKLIEELVKWENTNNEELLERARAEIWKSWRRTCEDNKDHPRAAELFNPDKLPAFHDPFAGGGSLPLEAQRLGLEAYASDLNPVAVLINKAMIEIPPKFSGVPPVNPESRKNPELFQREWKGAEGLAEDIRYYGKWMRDEAEKRIGHLYPKVKITPEMVRERPDLKKYEGRELTVIAWLWARTVRSPNPAFAHVHVPLVSTFMLCTKEGKEAYVEPVLEGDTYRFVVKVGAPADFDKANMGTKLGRGANFVCLLSGTPIGGDYIKAEGQAGRIGTRMLAVVAEGDRERVYLSPTPDMEKNARAVKAAFRPEVPISGSTQYIGVRPYGIETFDRLFTDRQLLALTTLSDLVIEAMERVRNDARLARTMNEHGSDAIVSWVESYAHAVGVYLAFAVDKAANYGSNVCAWHKSAEIMVSTFGMQAIQIVWDFTEANPFSSSSGNFMLGIEQAAKVVERLGTYAKGQALQDNATSQTISIGKVVSTDPPYYDNVPYADLSDFFYVWLRRSMRAVFPDLFGTVATPKSEELVAFAHRFGNRETAEDFFLRGMTATLRKLVSQVHPMFPITLYYAFRQAESDREEGTVSTGWETFLDAVIRAGLEVNGTWPVRTEYTRNLKKNRNALASSIVLVCRPRSDAAPIATRREFVTALWNELPSRLTVLQHSNIAPVDLAQAAIGPGMAIFTRYAKVLDAEGKPVTVREALALINQVLDEVLAEQEGDFDADTRWAVAWFEQHGFEAGDFGTAETLSKAKNTSVSGLVEAGIVSSQAGKVRLLRPSDLRKDWDPETDSRLNVWECVHQLIRVLDTGGEVAAADLLRKLGSRAEAARELAYRLYTTCERRRRAQEALAYNSLVQSWPEISRLAREMRSSSTTTASGQEKLF